MSVCGKKQDGAKKTMLDYAQPNFRRQRLSTHQKCKEIIDRNKDNNSTRFTSPYCLPNIKVRRWK